MIAAAQKNREMFAIKKSYSIEVNIVGEMLVWSLVKFSEVGETWVKILKIKMSKFFLRKVI